MKKDIHPETYEFKAHCTCGHEFRTSSTKKDISVTLCSQCHPFFTGEQKHIDVAGRIEKFNKKYSKKS